MKYHSAPFCKECHSELTEDEEMYSDGVCPHCGKYSESTIVDSYRRAYRLIEDGIKETTLFGFIISRRPRYKRVYRD